MKRSTQSGIALIVTLIMLAVITVMAIAFLAVSRRERVLVTDRTASLGAKDAAQTAFERAKGAIVGTILYQQFRGTNGTYPTNFFPLGPEMFVSRTTFSNSIYGDPQDNANDGTDIDMIASLYYDPRPPVFIRTNPVGTAATSPREFRFYLDMNRDGRFNSNGWNYVLDDFGQAIPGRTNFTVGDPEWIGIMERPNLRYTNDNRFVGRYAYLVLPVGRTLDVNYIHNQSKFYYDGSTNNFFGYARDQGVGSFEINLAAFLADLNTNAWGQPNVGYVYAPAVYPQPPASTSSGVAFGDAADLLRFRYGATTLADGAGALTNVASLTNFIRSLDPVAALYVTNFSVDGIDGYGNNPPDKLGLFHAPLDEADDLATYPWAGSPNLKNFFSVHDFFNNTYAPAFPFFRARLAAASSLLSTYNQFTYYRMLSQLGTDSESDRPYVATRYVENVQVNGPIATVRIRQHGYYSGDRVTFTASGYQQTFTNISVPDGDTFSFQHWGSAPVLSPDLTCRDPYANAKIHLNYDNINFEPWQFQRWSPTVFFTAVADRLLRQDLGLYLHHLPIYTNLSSFFVQTNLYTVPQVLPIYSPRVHQLLQITANILDSTRSAYSNEIFPHYPTVFRPRFKFASESTTNGATSLNVYANDFEEVNYNISNRISFVRTANFQAWYDLDSVVDRTAAAARIDTTNVNFYGIPFIFGAKKGLPNFNQFVAQDVVEVTRKIEFRRTTPTSVPSTNMMFILGVSNIYAMEAWNSYTNDYLRPLSMIFHVASDSALTNTDGTRVSFTQNPVPQLFSVPALSWRGKQFVVSPPQVQVVLPNSVYYQSTRRFASASTNAAFEPGPINYTNEWTLSTTNRMLYFLFDSNHLVDLVSLSGLNSSWPIMQTIQSEARDNYWDITPYGAKGTLSQGVRHQIAASIGEEAEPNWNSYNGNDAVDGQDKQKAIDGLRAFFGLSPIYTPGATPVPDASLAHQAGFTPWRKMYRTLSWEVNDPIVHYTPMDYRDGRSRPELHTLIRGEVYTNRHGLNAINSRYSPWGGRDNDKTGESIAIKDPFVSRFTDLRGSDCWNFPTNKFPNIGWIGRVHRGTPWQTVYLKASNAPPALWLVPNGPGQTMDTHPTNDWRLVDLFTTAIHPNLERGRLSINQSGLAAWSAVLSGVAITTSAEDADGMPYPVEGGGDIRHLPGIIQPAVLHSNVASIVAAINLDRTFRTYPYQYTRLSDILAVPELTDRSPYLMPPTASTVAHNEKDSFNTIYTDEDYERLPQQVLSLLKVGEPRFVIYAYGQSLKPADNSINLAAGANFRLCLNYQITGEYATRTVVRLEQPHDEFGRPNMSSTNAPRVVIESFNVLSPE